MMRSPSGSNQSGGGFVLSSGSNQSGGSFTLLSGSNQSGGGFALASQSNQSGGGFAAAALPLIAVIFLFAAAPAAQAEGPAVHPLSCPQGEISDRSTEPSAVYQLSSGTFLLINNLWGAKEARQGIVRCADGSYGWFWDRGTTGAENPNYPEVLVGSKPWGTVTTDIFPLQIKEVQRWTAELELELQVPRGRRWNLAMEFWLTEEKPGGGDVSDSVTDEVMIWLDWGPGFDGLQPVERQAVDDGSSVYSYAHYYPNHNAGWRYHQFRLKADEGTERLTHSIDLTAFLRFLSRRYELHEKLWISGLELGNEYWDNSRGFCKVQRFSCTVGEKTIYSTGK